MADAPIPYKDLATAPFIYFDYIGAYGVVSGTIQLELAGHTLAPNSQGMAPLPSLLQLLNLSRHQRHRGHCGNCSCHSDWRRLARCRRNWFGGGRGNGLVVLTGAGCVQLPGYEIEESRGKTAAVNLKVQLRGDIL
jgi:hypothetical protein